MTLPQSKSSLETLSDCAYKFGQIYLCNKRGEPSKAAQAGTLVHKRLEVWRNTGVEIDTEEEWNEYKIGKIAHVMCETLPPYGTPDIETEKDETFEIEGYTYRAIKDWTSPEILGDYKTTSRINADHVLTEETLRTDIQANLSARHMDRDLTLWWTYGQSQGRPKAKTVKLKVLRDEVRAQFHDVVEPLTVRALEALQQDPESLPRNKNACFKYGKCHLFNSCWVVPGQPMRFYMTGGGLLSKLNELKNGPAPEPPVNVNPPIELREAPPPEEEMPKKPRGRPKKTDPVVEALKAVEQDIRTMKPIHTLFADCRPITPSPSLLQGHELIAKAAVTVCADLQVQHIKLIDFGRGGACLAAQLEADILAMEPGFDLALDTRTVEGREVYQTLMSLSQHIVVGL